jgi:hypothetical protein
MPWLGSLDLGSLLQAGVGLVGWERLERDFCWRFDHHESRNNAAKCVFNLAGMSVQSATAAAGRPTMVAAKK